MAVRGVYTKDEEKMLEDWQESADELVGWLGDGDTASERVPYPIYHRVATKELITHMAYAADYWNPLYRDEDYARRTKWGGVIAPPVFQHCIAHGGPNYPLKVPPEVGVAIPAMGGQMWEFFQPIRVNDSFKVWVGRAKIDDITLPTENAPRRFAIRGKLSYINQKDEVTAILRRRGLVTILPPGTQKSKKEYKFTTEYIYTKEEIEAIDRLFDAEERRGAKPLYWEDVNVGDELKPIVKGPITTWDMVVEIQGFGLGILPMIEVRRQTPERVVIDPVTNIPHKSIEFHLTERTSQILGHYSTTMIAVSVEHFLCRLVTNWMGDDGFIKKHTYLKLNNSPIGDTIFGRGKVTKKYVDENGEHLVDLDTWMETVRGFIPNVAKVTVSLMSKEEVFK